MRPERKAQIRARHEHILAAIDKGQTPTHRQTLELVEDMSDLLAELTRAR